MSRAPKEIFERLSGSALLRVLDDLLDGTRLVRLAQACGISYPGIRTRSQKRSRLLQDLVDKARDSEAARKAIYRTLTKATASARSQWTRRTLDDLAASLRDPAFLLRDRNFGLALFHLAHLNGDPAAEELLRSLQEHPDLLPSPDEKEDSRRQEALESLKKDSTRLRKHVTELRRKVRHLESQLTKAREAEKQAKKDLIQRKGELAETRMLAERLKKDLDAARREQAARPTKEAGSAAGEAVAGLEASVKKLAAEQRKLLRKMDAIKIPEPKAVLPDSALKPLTAELERLRKDLRAAQKDAASAPAELTQAIASVRSELQRLREEVRASLSPTRPRRRRGAAERVGVFIDVQNVYYAARQLKGKLDFDMLLDAAVRGRRLIQAVAYVVESKETDQSDFIKLLEQRAITVRRKPLKVRADGSMKGNWDMEMALDILDAAANLDVVILVSGDGDFTSLVGRVKSMGPKVEVLAFPRNTAKSLLEAADHFQPLDRKFMIRTPPRKKKKATAKTASQETTPPEAQPEAAGS